MECTSGFVNGVSIGLGLSGGSKQRGDSRKKER